MSYFWTAFSFAAAGFVAGTIWGRWLQSAAIDKVKVLFHIVPAAPK